MPDLQTQDGAKPENAFGVNTLPTDVPEGVEGEAELELELGTEAPAEPSAEETAAKVEAGRYGWEDKDAWVAGGKDPSRWRPASEFLDVRTNVLKITREENGRLRAEVAALKARTDAKEQKENEDRNRLQLESLRLERQQARDEGDNKRADEISDRIAELRVVAPAKPAETTQAVDPEVRQAFDEFKANNKWLENDPDLRVDFLAETQLLYTARAAKDVPDLLAQAKRRVIRANPQKFSKGNGRASMTEMGGAPATSGNGRGWNDLKPEYRTEQVADQIRQKKFTLKDYLANCDADCFRR